jgi:hypothetical protein
MGAVMSFVTFPGLAGNYASTQDVNLLDADTAHTFQSVGNWTSNNRAQDWQVVDEPGGFSGKAVRWFATTTGASTELQNAGVGVSNPVAVPDGTVTASVLVKPSVDNVLLTLGLANGTNQNQGFDSLTPNQWNLVSLSGTATGGNDTCYLIVRVGFNDPSGIVENAFQYVTNASIRADASDVFVPSLRIVGDLDISATLDPSNWTDFQAIAGRRNAVTAQRSWYLAKVSDRLRLVISSDGTSEGTVDSDALNDPAGLVTCRVTWDRATVSFFLNGAPIGSTSFISDFFAADTPLEVGSINGGAGSNFDGNISLVVLRDGIDGPIVAQFDAADVGGVL